MLAGPCHARLHEGKHRVQHADDAMVRITAEQLIRAWRRSASFSDTVWARRGEYAAAKWPSMDAALYGPTQLGDTVTRLRKNPRTIAVS